MSAFTWITRWGEGCTWVIPCRSCTMNGVWSGAGCGFSCFDDLFRSTPSPNRTWLHPQPFRSCFMRRRCVGVRTGAVIKTADPGIPVVLVVVTYICVPLAIISCCDCVVSVTA